MLPAYIEHVRQIGTAGIHDLMSKIETVIANLCLAWQIANWSSLQYQNWQ